MFNGLEEFHSNNAYIIAMGLLGKIGESFWISNKTKECVLAAVLFKHVGVLPYNHVEKNNERETIIRTVMKEYNDNNFSDRDVDQIIKLTNFSYENDILRKIIGKINEIEIEKVWITGEDIPEHLSVEEEEKILEKTIAKNETMKAHFFLYQIVDFSHLYAKLCMSVRDIDVMLSSFIIMNTNNGLNTIVFHQTFIKQLSTKKMMIENFFNRL